MFSAELSTRECDGWAGLRFPHAGGLAALMLAPKHARDAGGDLLLVAPQRQVLRVLTVPQHLDVLSVHAWVEDAGSAARQSAWPLAADHRNGVR